MGSMSCFKGLFEALNTFGTTLAYHVKAMLAYNNLKYNILVCIKALDSNLKTLASVLKSVVSCVAKGGNIP